MLTAVSQCDEPRTTRATPLFVSSAAMSKHSAGSCHLSRTASESSTVHGSRCHAPEKWLPTRCHGSVHASSLSRKVASRNDNQQAAIQRFARHRYTVGSLMWSSDRAILDKRMKNNAWNSSVCQLGLCTAKSVFKLLDLRKLLSSPLIQCNSR